LIVARSAPLLINIGARYGGRRRRRGDRGILRRNRRDRPNKQSHHCNVKRQTCESPCVSHPHSSFRDLMSGGILRYFARPWGESGNANLPIGVLKSANQEIGVPGDTAKRGRRLPARTRDTKSAPAGLTRRARSPFARPVSCTRRIHRGGRIARWVNARASAANIGPA
jgi:hypothetical protein